MDTDDMNYMMRLCPRYLGTFAIDQLPGIEYPSSMIVNLDPSDQPGSHWVAIYITNRMQCYYFDTFARPIPQIIDSYLKSFSDIQTCNQVMQMEMSTVCGLHCIAFLYVMTSGASFKEYMDLFTNNKSYNDFIVSIMVKGFTK